MNKTLRIIVLGLCLLTWNIAIAGGGGPVSKPATQWNHPFFKKKARSSGQMVARGNFLAARSLVRRTRDSEAASILKTCLDHVVYERKAGKQPRITFLIQVGNATSFRPSLSALARVNSYTRTLQFLYSSPQWPQWKRGVVTLHECLHIREFLKRRGRMENSWTNWVAEETMAEKLMGRILEKYAGPKVLAMRKDWQRKIIAYFKRRKIAFQSHYFPYPGLNPAPLVKAFKIKTAKRRLFVFNIFLWHVYRHVYEEVFGKGPAATLMSQMAFCHIIKPKTCLRR